MSNSNQLNPEQASKPPERMYETAGMMLRKARESANLTHAAVSEALHLTVHYIKALENDDYSKLPGATFVKGYLRAYARFLKLDVNAILASYEKNNVSAEELSNRTELLSRNQKRHDQTFRWAVITAVIIVLGVAAGWWFVGKDQVVTSAVTVSPQLPAQQEVNQLAATANSFNRTTVSQSLNAPVPSEAARLASTPVATVNALAQDSGAVSSSTEQSLPLTGSDIVPATGTSAVVDRTVTTSTSMPTLNPATDSNDQPVHNPLTGSETVQTPVAGSTAINNQVAQAPAAETILAAIPDQEDVALSITPTADGAQQVTLISAGADMIQLSFKGTSWVEIDDGAKGRLYNETLNSGDVMTLHGTAPFKVLLGDAAQVDLSFNSVPINLASQIRSDKTARFSLGAAATPAVNTAAVSDANP